MFSCLLNDVPTPHVQGLAEVAFTNPHNGFARAEFRPCTSGTILRGGFPFGFAVFLCCPVRITLGTILNAMGDHIQLLFAQETMASSVTDVFYSFTDRYKGKEGFFCRFQQGLTVLILNGMGCQGLSWVCQVVSGRWECEMPSDIQNSGPISSFVFGWVFFRE